MRPHPTTLTRRPIVRGELLHTQSGICRVGFRGPKRCLTHLFASRRSVGRSWHHASSWLLGGVSRPVSRDLGCARIQEPRQRFSGRLAWRETPALPRAAGGSLLDETSNREPPTHERSLHRWTPQKVK